MTTDSNLDYERQRCEAAFGCKFQISSRLASRAFYLPPANVASVFIGELDDIECIQVILCATGNVYIAYTWNEIGDDESWSSEDGPTEPICCPQVMEIIVMGIYKLGFPPVGLEEHGLLPTNHQVMEWIVEMQDKGFKVENN